jgi:DNA-binding transcriptional ArsR family regulator
MDAPNFASFIEEERARIKEAIKAAKAKQQEAESEIAQLEAETAAIAAYDAARKGKKAPSEPRAPRGRRGEKRQAILDMIAQHPDGLTRHELIDQMNAHSDKAAEQSISNALSALKKAGQLTQEGKRYIART